MVCSVTRRWCRRRVWWDTETRKQIRIVADAHKKRIRRVAASPDGKLVASVSDDMDVKVWDVATGTMLLTLNGHTDGTTAVSFSPDGKRLASASWDKTAKIWDLQKLQTGKPIRVFNHDAKVNWASFSPDGKRVITARFNWSSYWGNKQFQHGAKIWSAEVEQDNRDSRHAKVRHRPTSACCRRLPRSRTPTPYQVR